MLGGALKNVRGNSPLIHCITNFVTANDCANILLACGASPIMACCESEAAEVASISAGLCLNIGTPNSGTMPAMLRAGRAAGRLGLPIVLDPVGAGGVKSRAEMAQTLISSLGISVIRGNLSEVRALAQGSRKAHGLDVGADESLLSDDLDSVIRLAKAYSSQTGAVIAITGKSDIVADADRAYVIFNGHPMLSKVTGIGCQLSALVAAFAAANSSNLLESTAAAVCAMGLCGEIAATRMTALDGSGMFRTYVMDAVFNLTPEILDGGGKYELR